MTDTELVILHLAFSMCMEPYKSRVKSKLCNCDGDYRCLYCELCDAVDACCNERRTEFLIWKEREARKAETNNGSQSPRDGGR